MSKARRLKSFKRLKGIVVISLFDGMSGGQLALERAGLHVETYYASEIDKYAMQVTQHNYPNTIHIGSVLDITIERLGKFEILLNGKYIIDTRKLIIIGGSPCQGFSFVGKRKGSSTECNIDVTTLEQYLDLKSKDFKFKGQSYLFWEYMRVLHAAEPMYYFLENVKMVKKWEGMFNDAMGHEPVIVNSALVSAQNRVRLYWTNIPEVTQPEDKGIYIKDILQDNVDAKFYMKQDVTMRADSKVSTDGLHHIADVAVNGHDIIKRVYSEDGKRQDHKMKTAGLTTQMLEMREDEKSNCLTTVQKDNVVVEEKYYLSKKALRGMRRHRRKQRAKGNGFGFAPIDDLNTKSKTLTDPGKNRQTDNYIVEHPRVRKLTPIECERLQTVPDNYTDIVINSQRYKMLGNGWTVDVIAHIFKGVRR